MKPRHDSDDKIAFPIPGDPEGFWLIQGDGGYPGFDCVLIADSGEPGESALHVCDLPAFIAALTDYQSSRRSSTTSGSAAPQETP